MASPLLSLDFIKEQILWWNPFETGECIALGTFATKICGKQSDTAVFQTGVSELFSITKVNFPFDMEGF